MLFKNILPVAALAAAASAQTILEALTSQNATLSTLISLLGTQPAIVSALSGATDITVLAPSNDALAKLLATPEGAALATQPDAVAALLSYHVLNGTLPGSAFKTTPVFVHTLLTNTSYTNVTGGQVVEGYLNGTTVTIVSGALQKSLVTKADVKFTGGVIHIIDSVLTLPLSDSATATAAGLTSLAGALSSVNLVSTVDGLADVTIFGPTNDAFAAIASTVSTLTPDQLKGILTYHVVAGTVGYSTLLSNTTLKTVNGGSVTITVGADGSVFVNAAKVVIPDVLVSNGVVHVIDSVLSPPASNGTTPGSGSNSTVTTGSPTPTGGSGGSGGSGSSATGSATGSAKPSSATTAGGAQNYQVGAMSMGALLGGAALLLGNL